MVKTQRTSSNLLIFVNMETISLLFNQANVLPTLAMLVIAAYWLLMIVGVVGMDTLDFDVDVDPGLDLRS